VLLPVAGWAAADPPTERVLLRGGGAVAQLDAVVVGPGIPGTRGVESVSREGSRVVWQIYHDMTDELGLRHTFYQQVLMPGETLGRWLGAPYESEGIPVLGGEIGVHVDGKGVPYFVFGRQARRVEIGALPAVADAHVAVELAHSAARSWRDFRPAEWSVASADERAATVAATRLALRAGETEGFRFVWEVPVRDEDGTAHMALLDASTGELIELSSTVRQPVCGPPASPNQQTAAVVPQNSGPGIYRGSVRANLGSDRTGWSHEAHAAKVNKQRPQIDVYKRWGVGDPNTCPQKDYALLALNRRAPGGPSDPPQYADDTTQRDPNPLVEGTGCAAGDAMFHTMLVMDTLKQQFGWCGYDGTCSSVANLLVDKPAGVMFGYAYLDRHHELGPGLVAVSRKKEDTARSQPPPYSYPYTGSASLDVMGHEWGHAVVMHSPAQSFKSSPDAMELDEGFANVLGHSVEWWNQAPGKGYERADWCFGEDHYTSSWPSGAECPSSWSRADQFVEHSRHPNWLVYRPAPSTIGSCYSFHADHLNPLLGPLPSRCDFPDSHTGGHRLSVALYLLASGGKNPICPGTPGGGKPGWTAGCAVQVPGLGYQAASKILMRVLTRYATRNTRWTDLAELGKVAAFDLYRNCSIWLCPDYSNPALYQQMAVNAAFEAIGYGGDDEYLQCICPELPPGP